MISRTTRSSTTVLIATQSGSESEEMVGCLSAGSAATDAARETGSLMPPKHILNAPTRLMRDLGYGKGYQYDHSSEDAFSGQDCFPDGMERREFYRPVDRGFERDISKRLAYWSKLRARIEAGQEADDGDG